MNLEASTAADSLIETPLELAYVKSRGVAHLQCAPDSFVLFDGKAEKLTIFGELPDLTPGSFFDEQASYVFQDAQKHGAAFTVKDGRCSCDIGTVHAEGGSYVEAALRALIAYRADNADNKRAGD
ncbi:hypothetical protein [Comamonas jiangduensis]|uniref:hypothetical protein n=1 Tax=Comamonas jiangduensis TaxID=1194168 RepID=UPI001582C157|nr:hypothetical protein [Comamonas jiangduensis]